MIPHHVEQRLLRTSAALCRGATVALGASGHVAAAAASLGARAFGSESEVAGRGPPRPTMDVAKALPLTTQELDNSTLVTLSALGNLSARVEIVKRHIMSVDGIDYDEAAIKFKEIEKKNVEFQLLFALPYKIGIGVAVTAGFASFPLVFDLNTAMAFNSAYVTTDVPDPEDLETFLEVGSWTWDWMEPVLGQVSFFLLCLQYSRAQIEKLGMRPYTERMKSFRAKRLAAAFPQYDAGVLMGYSKTVPTFTFKKSK